MPDVRGTAYVAVNKWVQNQLGEEGYRKFLKTLEPGPRDILVNAVSKDWYHEQNAYAIYKLIVKVIGKDDDAVLVDLGEFIAVDNLNSFFKGLISFATPDMLLKRAHTFWSKYNNGGRITVEKIKPGAYRMIMWDHYGGGEVCPIIQGWITAALRISRAKNVRATHPVCRYRTGADRCVWELSWD